MRSQGFYTWNGSAWIGGTSRYIYDGRLIIQERTSSDTPTVAYTRGTDLSGTFQGAGGIGGLLARSSTYQSGNFTNHHAYHADAGGNITSLVATNQIVSATYRYEPYGKLIAQTGAMAGQNLYRFNSKMFVSGDLYHYGYRFYDPYFQRWINQDPLGEEGGINLHCFVLNNPFGAVDPFGLSPSLNPQNQAYACEAIESAGANAARNVGRKAAQKLAEQGAKSAKELAKHKDYVRQHNENLKRHQRCT